MEDWNIKLNPNSGLNNYTFAGPLGQNVEWQAEILWNKKYSESNLKSEMYIKYLRGEVSRLCEKKSLIKSS